MTIHLYPFPAAWAGEGECESEDTTIMSIRHCLKQVKIVHGKVRATSTMSGRHMSSCMMVPLLAGPNEAGPDLLGESLHDRAAHTAPAASVLCGAFERASVCIVLLQGTPACSRAFNV